MTKQVLFIQHCHMDPVWRRCFARSSAKDGIVTRGYAEIEALQINRWLDLAPRGYTFSEGQAAVWRKFLEWYPEKRPLLQDYARSGILNVMLAGETVQDSNMSTAEGLVRNFLAAWPFYKDLVGEDHPALKLAWLEDAFGNSPNMPQVLRGVGAEVACKLSYRQIQDADVWVGIDGSRIFVLDNYPQTHVGGYHKQPPCYECLGVGCDACGQTGLTFVDSPAEIPVARAIEDALAMEGDWAVTSCNFEEFRPNPWFLQIIEELRNRYQSVCDIRWSNFDEIHRLHRPEMEARSAGRDDTPTRDLNPGMPGCYVTHIRNKQRTRSIAYKLIGAESLLATESWRADEPVSYPDDLTSAWRDVLFNQFHDALTGTHVDGANVELMEMLDHAEGVVDRYLPRPAKAAHAGRFTRLDGAPTTRRLGTIDVKFDREGILSILCDGQDLFGERGQAASYLRPFRIGELVLEEDWGDAWGQRKAAHGSVEKDFSAMALGYWHDTVEAAPQAIRWRGRYRGNFPAIRKLQWTTTVTPSTDGRRLEFTTDVDWDTHSRRLRVYVPVRSDDSFATWEVPFGFIDRKYDPAQLDYTDWHGNSMEFPALHWVMKRIDAKSGVAMLNKGLPCYRWVPGRLDLSLLRSPEMPFCNVPIDPHDRWDIDGWRDTGKHRFEYALFPFTEGLSAGDLTRTGYDYNLPHPLRPPFQVAGDVLVTAWKPAEDGTGWILRIQDAGGSGGHVAIQFPSARSLTVTNLLEQPQSAPVSITRFETTIHRHGILTLKIGLVGSDL